MPALCGHIAHFIPPIRNRRQCLTPPVIVTRSSKSKLSGSSRKACAFQWKIRRKPVQLDDTWKRGEVTRGRTFRWSIRYIDYTVRHFGRTNSAVPPCNLSIQLLFRFPLQRPALPVIFIELYEPKKKCIFINDFLPLSNSTYVSLRFFCILFLFGLVGNVRIPRVS